jgi:hypothetical protein
MIVRRWDAAPGGKEVGVNIAIVFSGECYPVAVGGEYGIGFDADTVGQAFGVAAVAGDRPQVARVDEGDAGAVNCWFLKEGRGLGLAQADAGSGENEEKHQD